MFFSFDVGPVHFISVSTEYLYDPTKDENWAKLQGQGAMIQYRWLVNELEKSTTEESIFKNLDEKDWIQDITNYFP